jgi:hypothetical protein
MTRSSILSEKIGKEKQQSRIAASVLIGVFFIMVIIILVNALKREPPAAPSLSDNWEKLETNAHKSYPDSYLTLVSIDISRKNPYWINVEYHSQSQPNLLLLVGIDFYGKVHVKPFTSPPLAQSSMTIPVYREDWSIDSQEALLIFAKDETINSCLISSKDIIELLLYKIQTSDGEFAVWQLSIVNCPEEGKAEDFYLNAVTGESFDPRSQ